MLTFKEWRRAKGISAHKMADELGVNYTTIIRWERGKSKMPIDKAAMYCRYLGITFDDVKILDS